MTESKPEQLSLLAKQNPSVSATPENVSMVFQAVLNMQLELGKQSTTCETLDRHYMEQREDIRAMEKLIETQVLELKTSLKAMNRTMKVGWGLLLAIGGGAAWTILRIWEIFLPFLQTKLGMPTR